MIITLGADFSYFVLFNVQDDSWIVYKRIGNEHGKVIVVEQ